MPCRISKRMRPIDMPWHCGRCRLAYLAYAITAYWRLERLTMMRVMRGGMRWETPAGLPDYSTDQGVGSYPSHQSACSCSVAGRVRVTVPQRQISTSSGSWVSQPQERNQSKGRQIHPRPAGPVWITVAQTGSN